MGNYHSHDKKEAEGSGSSGAPRDSNAGSEAENPRKPQSTSLVPLEKLCKILVQHSQKEDGVNGITKICIKKYLFPSYPELGRRFYRYVHRTAKCQNAYIPAAAFKAQSERLLSLLDDAAIIETYVRMFASDGDENDIFSDGFFFLVHTSYELSMDHYPEGPRTCPEATQTLSVVEKGCFNNHQGAHSVGYVVRWLSEHCHRLIFPIHRYCVHVLATRHRELETNTSSTAGSDAGLQLATPVLERGRRGAEASSALLPLSAAWLLAAAAPPLYSRPTRTPPHQGGLASRAWLARLVCAVPVHWVPLYNSRGHGLGANRFLHHTLAYRGPTLMLLHAQELLLVLCAPQEWKETHQYWGTKDSALIQMKPSFSVVEIAPKMIYLNTSIRGYPKGLRAGSDPRKPLLIVREGFDKLSFKDVPYAITSIEVWGCGDQSSRETQLEIKKWQVREAERQRTVKLSSADWLDHPDRYLLELAGRPQYNDTGS